MNSFDSELFKFLLASFITFILHVVMLIFVCLKPCDSFSYYALLGLIVYVYSSLILEIFLYIYKKKLLRFILLYLPLFLVFLIPLLIASLVPKIEKECINTPIHPLLITYLVLYVFGGFVGIFNFINDKTMIDFLINKDLEN